jgi:hypothetical protein
MLTRNQPPPARKRLFVMLTKPDFTVREEAPSTPKFTRRAVKVKAMAVAPGEIKPPTKSRLMARR